MLLLWHLLICYNIHFFYLQGKIGAFSHVINVLLWLFKVKAAIILSDSQGKEVQLKKDFIKVKFMLATESDCRLLTFLPLKCWPYGTRTVRHSQHKLHEQRKVIFILWHGTVTLKRIGRQNAMTNAPSYSVVNLLPQYCCLGHFLMYYFF